MIALKHILIATDFGEASANALAYGRELARRFDATLHIVHVVDDVGARMMAATGLPYDQKPTDVALELAGARLDALVTEEDRRELRVETRRLIGTVPSRAIAAYAAESRIDLIIVGTHGRGMFGHLLMGSVAEHVVRAAPCPVLTVHEREHEFIQPDALQVVCAV